MTDLTITVVRHGDTFAPGEVPRRIGARTDLPLVASGIAQGRALGRAFAAAGMRFDRVLAGPLVRTRETAGLILAACADAPPVVLADWLAEIDHGPDEDRCDGDVVARIGRAALSAWDGQGVVPDGWIADPGVRCDAWRALYGAGGGHVLIVTSNGAARFALLADADLVAQAADRPSLKLRTGAYGVIERRGGRLALRGWDARPAA